MLLDRNIFRTACFIVPIFLSSANAANSPAEQDNLQPLTSIQVEVAPVPDWVEANGTTRAKLRAQIEAELRKKKIKLSDGMDDTGGVLDLSIVVLTSKDHNAYVYGARLILGERVRLTSGKMSYVSAWEDTELGASDDPAKAAVLVSESVDDSLNKFMRDFTQSQNTKALLK